MAVGECRTHERNLYRDTDRYLFLTGASSSLVYDPAVDLWTPVTLSSPDPDWRPSRAAVHRDAVYFLGNRSTPHSAAITHCSNNFRDGQICKDFYKIDLNQGCQILEQEHFKDDRNQPSFSSCDGYLYLISGGQVRHCVSEHYKQLKTKEMSGLEC